jgi:myosin heavy subunit
MSDSLGSILPLNEDFSNALRNGMGLNNIEIEQVFTFLSGIILIGQLSDNEEIESECLANCCKMLHIDSIELRKYLEYKAMNIGDEKISIQRTADQKQKFRGSLASDLYSVLFHWVVDRINNVLFSETNAANLSPGISLIDIFGFETLQENCFEQLLINYANEKLHYFFISVSVIKEQELYKEEEIPLTDFDFSRLFDVLSAIEGPAGIIDLLHDQISLNQPDTYLIHKIRQAQNRKNKPNPMQIVQLDKFQPLFKICHYAGDVRYSIEGTTERNNDIPVGYLKELKGICQHPVLTQYVESVEKKQSITDKNYKQARSSVARNFREELTHMIEVIENAGIHFIKCINPNSNKAPLLFHPKAVSNQLLFNGISEVAAVVRSKYMCYYTVAEFFQKFGALLPLAFDRTSALSALKFLLSEEAHYAVGKTKVFLSEKGYYMLENCLMLLIRSVILIQTRIRGYQHQKCYKARLSRVLRGRKIIITSIKRFIFRKRVALRVLRNKFILFLKRRALLAWCNILIPSEPLLPVNIDTSKESLVTSCDVLTSTSISILSHSCHQLDVEDIYDILELIIFVALGLIVYISSLYFI